MPYTNNPLADFINHDREQEAQLQKMPVCCYCDEHIQDEHLYLINDEFVCPKCLKGYFRKNTDDFID